MLYIKKYLANVGVKAGDLKWSKRLESIFKDFSLELLGSSLFFFSWFFVIDFSNTVWLGNTYKCFILLRFSKKNVWKLLYNYCALLQ